MKKKEKLAIILVNYNGMQDTIDCIQSILNSKNMDFNFSIIVVDNNSKLDDLSSIERSYPSVIGIKNTENLGFSGANNIGIQYALKQNYEYIMLLNNDTIVDENMIDILMKECVKNTIVAPLMLYYDDPNKIWYAGGKISRVTGNNYHLEMGKYIKDISLEKKECTFITGCCMFAHSSTFETIGLLNDEYFMYCEDTEFCIRATLKKCKMIFVPDAKLWHKISSSSGGSFSPFSIYYCTRNRLKYVQEYKKYFYVSAFPFSYISRIIRMYQYWFKKDDIRYSAFQRGIEDFNKKRMGKRFS